jgi:hypothetical protein
VGYPKGGKMATVKCRRKKLKLSDVLADAFTTS